MIFFDELPSAPRSVQAASYKIILDRLIGEHPLHSKVYIMAAGNLITDMAIANEMGTALRSRMIHIPVASNPDCWLDYAAKASFDTRVISYLTYQTSKINNFKHFEGSQDETFACERTWEFVSKLLKANCPDATQPVPEDMTALLAGTVGSIAYEFVTYTEAFKDLPSLQDVLKNSLQCPIPATPAVRFLMMGMLVGSATLENANTIGEYVDRFPKEFGMIFVKMLWGKSDKFLSIPSIDLLLNKVADMLHN